MVSIEKMFDNSPRGIIKDSKKVIKTYQHLTLYMGENGKGLIQSGIKIGKHSAKYIGYYFDMPRVSVLTFEIMEEIKGPWAKKEKDIENNLVRPALKELEKKLKQ